MSANCIKEQELLDDYVNRVVFGKVDIARNQKESKRLLLRRMLRCEEV